MRIFLVLLLLGGCVSAQKPNQTVINYTDNSQIIQVVGDSNNMSAVSDTKSEQTASADQKNEQTTKNGMWIFWLVVLGVVSLGCVFLYFYLTKWKK